jgi:hypothetical protein
MPKLIVLGGPEINAIAGMISTWPFDKPIARSVINVSYYILSISSPLFP